jgi:hypothetical protein
MADAEEQDTPPKIPKSAGERAAYNLRAARKAYAAIDWAEDRKSEFLVQEAQVLAILELADVLRGGETIR